MKFRILAGLGVAALMINPAFSAQALTVQVDKSQLITVSSEPGTVVIGNPSIADVSINGKQVFVHGHSFGDTNLLILDTAGNQIANFDLTVAQNNENAVALFAGPNRFSYTCAPLCETTMQVGDAFSFTESIIKLNQGKSELATGKKSAEAAAPAAAQ
jgi:hypothetical protein